ncbi:MAG: superinfection immunity protein [Acidobacteriota bacterium]
MKLEIVSLGLIFFSIIVITLGIIKIHTYPGKIAEARNHPQAEAIDVTSLLGLIIFPFWMVALIWAYSGAVIGKLYDQESEQPTSPTPEPVPRKTADNGDERTE